jgi:DNA-binding winged helix-turn-helix (wHTH) protein/Tol biopolymer transport system component
MRAAQTDAHSVKFRFADVEVCEDQFSVTKAGVRLAVQPKAFRVLLYLLHHSDRMVSKDELLSTVWGDAAVTDNSLTRVITLLRHVLDDDPHQPHFIETVATLGYRFIYPAEIVENAIVRLAIEDGNGHKDLGSQPESAKALTEPIPEILAASRSRTIHRQWLIAIPVIVGCLATAVWLLRRPLPPPRVIQFSQVTHDGSAKNLRGTDGVRLYFNVDFKLQQPIAQVPISGGDVVPIPIHLPAPELFDVSSDGARLLVTSTEGGRTALWSVGVSGSPLRHLADGDITSAHWSSDGTFVAYTTASGHIDVMRSDGTEVHTVFADSKNVENELLWGPRWSPDGRVIRFMRDRRFWEMSPDGSNLHPLHPDFQPSMWECCGSWTPDGRFFIFRVYEAAWRSSRGAIPGSELWALDERRELFRRPAPKPVQLASGPIRWGFPIPDKHKARIFVRGNILQGEVVRYDANSNQLKPYLGGISAEFVAFSPDGHSLVYGSYPEGILWRANRDGGNLVQLTSPPWFPMNPRWSPDGTEILFSQTNSEGKTESYRMPSEGGTPQPLFPGDKLPQADGNWSPDGKRIVTTTDDYENSDLVGAKRAIQILELATHKVTTLPGSTGKWSPRWSPDGRFIAGLDSPDWNLVVFDFETRHWSTLQMGKLGYPTWSHDGEFLYFLQGFDDNPGVYRIRPSGGKAERVVDLKGVRLNGATVFWMGLDPDDVPLVLRNTGTDEIYALTLEPD